MGGAGRGCVPLISQSNGSDSVITHVNTEGDPRHVVTLVGLMVKIAEPIIGVENSLRHACICNCISLP